MTLQVQSMTNNKFSQKGIAISTVLLIISSLGFLSYQNRYFLLLKAGFQPNNVCSSDMNIVAIDRYINQKYNGNVNVKVTAPDDFMTESLTDHDMELLLLNCAIKFDKPEIVENLLKRGANPNLFDYYGREKHKTTSLHDGVSILYSRNEKIIKLLLEHGANPNLSNHNGNTPLHMISYSIARTYYSRMDKCHKREKMPFDMLSLFIKYKADPNLKNNLGDTPLHIIAREDRPVEYAHLVKLGGNPLLKNNKGETAQQLRQLPKKYELLCKK
jgi:ankyrin repeat protein